MCSVSTKRDARWSGAGWGFQQDHVAQAARPSASQILCNFSGKLWRGQCTAPSCQKSNLLMMWWPLILGKYGDGVDPTGPRLCDIVCYASNISWFPCQSVFTYKALPAWAALLALSLLGTHSFFRGPIICDLACHLSLTPTIPALSSDLILKVSFSPVRQLKSWILVFSDLAIIWHNPQ